jgi:hypothetical protein
VGYITVWPSNQAQPFTSTLNAVKGVAVANAAIVKAGTGAISVYATGDTNLQVSLNGYFGPAHIGEQSGDALYNLLPCRGNDTRPYQFTDRIDYVLQSQGGCQSALPPITAPAPPIDAYVLNATVVPQASLGYLGIWPYGRQMPVAPTLVATDSAITSNMAIVPVVRKGEISAFASGPTNLIYDVFAYFASPQLTILTDGLPAGTMHVPYSFTMSARGGVPPYKWGATGLPANLGIDKATGTISGCPVTLTPGIAGISVQDFAGTPAAPYSEAMTIHSLPKLTIATGWHLPDGTRNTPYNETLTATGGFGAYTWSLIGGTLPPGLSLGTDGVVSGYISQQNAKGWEFEVQLADQECQGTPRTQWFHIYVN